MSDDRTTFEQTNARLEEILEQVRRKDTSLEQSLELLEEGVRLANRSNELIDQTSWRAGAAAGAEEVGEDSGGPGESHTDEEPSPDEDGSAADVAPAPDAASPEDDARS